VPWRQEWREPPGTKINLHKIGYNFSTIAAGGSVCGGVRAVPDEFGELAQAVDRKDGDADGQFVRDDKRGADGDDRGAGFEPPIDLMRCGKVLVSLTSAETTPLLGPDGRRNKNVLGRDLLRHN
jgi:hypothetical protein